MSHPDYPWQDTEPLTPFPRFKATYCPECGNRMTAERWWDKDAGKFLTVYRSACKPGIEWIYVAGRQGTNILQPFDLDEAK